MSCYIEGNEFPHVTKCTKEEFERDSEPLVVNNYIVPEVEDKVKENNNPLPEWDNSTTYLGGEEVMFNGKKCAVSAGVGNTPIFEEEERVGEPIIEEMVESDVAFSSRFMPGVKFRHDIPGSYGALVLPDGESIECMINSHYSDYINIWEQTNFPEVSIYEAVPEKIPKGMFYDKDSDSLVKIKQDVAPKKNITKEIIEKIEELLNELKTKI